MKPFQLGHHQPLAVDSKKFICHIHYMIIEQTIDIQPNHRLVFDLPFELPIGKAKVKLTVIPENNKSITEKKSAFGCLSQFADPSKISGEEDIWAQAVLEKHAKN